MDDLEQALLTYIAKNSNSRDELIQNIELFQVDRILCSDIKSLDIQKWKQVKNRIHLQCLADFYRKQEIIRITQLFRERKLDLIHFKGMSLAADLYHPSYIRKSGDIDILVDKKQLKSVFEAFLDLGYEIGDYKDAVTKPDEALYAVNGAFQYMISRCSHMAEIHKKFNTDFTISLDIHTRLFGAFDYDEFSTGEIFDRKTVMPFANIKIPVLEMEDRLLQMLYHFSKEITGTDFKFLLTEDIDNNIRLNLLHDIALFIRKYQGKINWYQILQRSIRYKIYGETLFSLKMLKEVYGILSNNIEQKIFYENLLIYDQNLMSGFSRRAVGKLLKLNEKQLRGRISQIFMNIVDQMNWIGPQLVCTQSGQKLQFYDLDEKSDKKLNRFNTYIRNIKDDVFTYFIPAIAFEWDEKAFLVYLKILFQDEKALRSYQNHTILIQIGGAKNFEEKPFIESFTFYCLDNTLMCKKSYRSDCKETIEYEYDYKVECYHERCELRIRFPWEYLRTRPNLINELWFDMAITVNGTQIALANPIYNRGIYDDITMSAKLSLKNK